ncbi:MAG: PEP-CTERM sorting domain-containing protein [Planctomycetota bacterium]
MANGYRYPAERKTFFIEGHVTSVVFIAEPTTMILVGLGGLALLKKHKV